MFNPRSRGPQKRLHVVVGTPDPDGCPICRAHVPGPRTKSAADPEVGAILVQELSLSEMLRCSCPLCAEARQRLPEG
jgi:hypothetical protein